MTEIVLRIAGFLFGSRVIGSLLDSHGKLRILRYEQRLHLIQDARFYLNRLNSMSYRQTGDFRNDLIFQNFAQYFSKKLQNNLEKFTPFNKLLSQDRGSVEFNENQLKQILKDMTTEVAHLEHKWLRK